MFDFCETSGVVAAAKSGPAALRNTPDQREKKKG